MAKNPRHRTQRRADAKARRARRKSAEAPPDRAGLGPKGRDAARLPLEPPEPARLLPPIYLDRGGREVPDPYATLGLEPGVRDPERVQAAWRQTLREHPPERDPDGARLAQEARQRLTDPARVLERELGVVRLPDPTAWGLPTTPPAPPRMSARSRLVGQAALYVLLEEELQRVAPPPVPKKKKAAKAAKEPAAAPQQASEPGAQARQGELFGRR